MQNLINLALVNIAAFLLLSSKYLKCASHTVRNVPTHLPPPPSHNFFNGPKCNLDGGSWRDAVVGQYVG